jgi:hypothetical protein
MDGARRRRGQVAMGVAVIPAVATPCVAGVDQVRCSGWIPTGERRAAKWLVMFRLLMLVVVLSMLGSLDLRHVASAQRPMEVDHDRAG